MKRAFATTTVVLAACIFASPAAALTPVERQLRAQVKTLQAQVKALQAQTKKLNTQVTNLSRGIGATLAYSACNTAVTADALQGTWLTLDQKLGTTFGAQTALNDFNSCTALQVNRARTPVPPNAGVFQALLNLFA
jgi:septal ring factor EnvC (AmiA/AmiB activator)